MDIDKLLTISLLLLLVAVANAQESVDEPIKDVPTENVSPSKKPDKTVKESDGEKGGDTYNFYFQKGSGPQKVEQGREQKVEQGASAAGASEAQVPSKTEPIPLPRFEAQIGLVSSPANSGAGLMIGGQFNASSFLGFQVHLIEMHEQATNPDSSTFSADGSTETKTSAESSGGSFAVAVTPFTVGEASLPVRLSALAGISYFTTTFTQSNDSFSAFGDQQKSNSWKDSRVLPFLGISATAYLNKTVGVTGFGKLMADPKFSQVGIGLAWLL